MALAPTLWRTCRVLAGETRLGLLRLIIESPDLRVTDLAASAGLSESRTSQELRRLQARGLVQAVRAGAAVSYRPAPDPLVASAKPLLAAVSAALAKYPADDAIRVAKAFGHERRLQIVRTLLKSPCGFTELATAAAMSEMALFRHLQVLRAGGMVRKGKRGWELAPQAHPLAQALLRLLAD